ncbi:hypothetical protein V8E53_006964 [Lactarius tabidus]
MSEALSTQDHAELLAMEWWTVKEFRQHGVQCRDGPFTPAETDRINDAIREYQDCRNLSRDDIEDIIFSVTKHKGFWAHITRSVPLRRVRSVYDHTRQMHHAFRKAGKWTEIDDERLKDFVGKKLDWRWIGEHMERPADECRRRHQKLAKRVIERQGKWTPEEETRLNSILQDMNERGRRPELTPKFWAEVSRLMDHTQNAKQCSNKCAALLKTPCWREADSRLLFRKIALLDYDTEDDLRWDDLIDDEWRVWTGEKLREKWVALRNEVRALAPNATHRDVVQQLALRFSVPRKSST